MLFRSNANLKQRFWDLKAYKKLNDLIVTGQYDLVQANASDTLKYAALSKFLYGWKAKLVYRNANKISDFLTHFVKKGINRFFIKQVDAVASVSEACRVDFLNQFPTYERPVYFLPIGINTHSIVAYDSFSSIGLELARDHVFVHVGSFVPEKNHRGLIAIFEHYLSQDPSAKLLLIGEGPLKAPTEQLLVEKKLESRIFVLGKRADVLQIMPLCKALLLPSLIEGLPGVILEAMYAKIPVIAYHVGGIGEVVTNETGFLIEKNDEGGFVKAMRESLNCSREGALCGAAYALVTMNYNNQKIARDFEEVYGGLISRHADS